MTTTIATPPNGAGAPPAATTTTTPPPTTAAPAVDPAALQAELAAAKAALSDLEARAAKSDAEIHKVNDEAAKRRVAEREAREAAEAEARKKGELEKVIASLETKYAEAEKELARVRGFEDGHKAWTRYQEVETAAIEAKVPTLPAHWAEAIKASPSLEAKRKIMAAFEVEAASRTTTTTTATTKQPATPAPAGGAPAGTPAPTVIDATRSSPEELSALKESNPDAYYAAIGGRPGAQPKKPGFMQGLFGK